MIHNYSDFTDFFFFFEPLIIFKKVNKQPNRKWKELEISRDIKASHACT